MVFQITRGIHTDCLLNYETVKYFNGEEHEGERYREAIREYQALEYKVISEWIVFFREWADNFLSLQVSLNLLNLVQNFIITLGLLIGSLMVAYRITQNPDGNSREFVMFITYLTQVITPNLQGPSWFNTFPLALRSSQSTRLYISFCEPISGRY